MYILFTSRALPTIRRMDQIQVERLAGGGSGLSNH